MAVSEERRAQNRDRDADPHMVIKVMRRSARQAARDEVREAVGALIRAEPPEWLFHDYQVAAYRAEVQRLLSRI